MKTLLLGIAFILAASSAMADTTANADVIHDKPGPFVHLDIGKVLAQTDLTSQCGIVPARLDYLDHAGREHVLDYQVYGYGCNDNN